ncbi:MULTISPECIES: hypothetical protein [Pseudomonas]|uniref:hypothetical protein n=1 Tax=Pseudomonas TaxID=286 RepID=UPI000C32608E|nr:MULTISPECIES: hypothetical protein [Pseudomonas]PWD01994.1 hypothetical protein CX658_18740 [Pseudomonas amygdali pv. lachrymans]WNZ87529.1 hypothetical protein QOM10_30045 [Pseudomonas sp. P108]
MNKRRQPSPQEAKVIYAEREARVDALASSGSITSADLKTLDRIGRCKVANDHWSICDEQARNALANDPHHFVRSCAALAG